MQLFALLSGVFVAFSVIAIIAVRLTIPLKLRYHDNAVIGNVSSLISLIYGVLAGLMALYLITNLTSVTDAVQREANAIADIYRDSEWLAPPAHAQLRTDLQKYLHHAITVEWPLMETGKKIDDTGDKLIENIGSHLIGYGKKIPVTEQLIVRDILSGIKALYDARQERINMSYNSLSSEIWLVIIIGTLLTIGINFLFGINFYLHIFTVSATALMASSMIFLLLTLDRPFQGEFTVGSDPLKTIEITLENNKAPT